VPLQTPGGLPIGLQLIAAPFKEEACLRAAWALEKMGIAKAAPATLSAQ
jgi:aspartyl-tRNA(Asn)/glutamyl-tRNA(Gln) amidotransferase subunit A